MENLTLGLAFLAGLASFLSPCVFSLVPAYVSYLSGRSLALAGSGAVDEENVRWMTFAHGVAFVLGFSVVFVTLGVAASALGGLLYDLRLLLAKLGGVIVVVFGLHMIGLFRIKWLEYDLRPQSRPDRQRGLVSSALLGVFFSAGWSPCVGPVLGAILTLALNGGSVRQGAILLSAYSAGLAIPFLLAALGMGRLTAFIRRYSKATRYVEIAMGVVLTIVGVLLASGVLEQMARFGFFVDLGL